MDTIKAIEVTIFYLSLFFSWIVVTSGILYFIGKKNGNVEWVRRSKINLAIFGFVLLILLIVMFVFF